MTLPALNLYLFGPLRIEQNGAPVVSRRRKAQALLAYLAVTGQPHSRDALATLLWPEFNQNQARTNLRRELAELRGLLGEARLLDDRVTVALNREPPFALDLTTFQQHLAQARQCPHLGHPAGTNACPACLPHLDQAATLYTDDFLAGFALPDSPTFDDWHFFQADGLRQTLAQLLTQLVHGHSAAQQFAAAIPHARRWVALDPLHEPAHCALMVAYELAGQRAAALRQYETCVRVLEEELGAPPAEGTTGLYAQIRQRVGETGEAAHIPTWPVRKQEERPAESHPPTPPPLQAPAPPPHFVGREEEITHLCTALLQPDTPIYALVGMGGAGKTTLAAQIAQLLRDDFTDGVLWANAVSSDPMDIAAIWARAYGYDFSGLSDLESRAAAIRGVLAEKAVLLVLDNVDQTSGIRPLLPNGNHCAVLLTTRDLDAANALNAQVLFLGELSAENSRQLLAAILGAARVVAEEEAAAEIGALLHYLPLAVEIVAQRLKSRPRQRLSQLVARLQDEAQRLDLEISDRAVRTSFAVSWATLDEGLQRCFALLGVFAGRPFTAAAIAYLAEAGLGVTEEWLFALEALSLVKAEGERYYRQHPLLADFAREKLGDVDGVSGRMADYYYEFAQVNQDNYVTLEPEWGNVMAAIGTAHHQQRWQMTADYANILTHAWFAQGRYTEARHVFRLVYDGAVQMNDETLLANTLLRWGEACLEQNDYDEARTHLEKSMASGMQLEEDECIAAVQYHLARIAIEQNQYDEAIEHLSQCLFIREQTGDFSGIATARYQQAVLSYAKDEFAIAQEYAEQALTYQAAANEKRMMAPTLRLLAHIAMYTPTENPAHTYAEQALKLCEELQDSGELAATLHTLTAIRRWQGDFSAAKACGEKAIPQLQRLGLRRTEGLLLYQMSIICKELKEWHSALDLAQKCVVLLRSVRDPLNCAYALLLLGDLYDNLSQNELRESAWAEALKTGQALQHPWLLEQLQQRMN